MKKKKKIPRETMLRFRKEKKKCKINNRNPERKLHDKIRLNAWKEKRGEL